MARPSRSFSTDPRIAIKQMAGQLAKNSIVTKALARYIEQVLEAVHEDTIAPLMAENERLRTEVAAAIRARSEEATDAR